MAVTNIEVLPIVRKNGLLLPLVVLTVVSLLGGLALFAYFGFGIGQPPFVTEGTGSAQILGGPDEAWLFMEKEIIGVNPAMIVLPKSGRWTAARRQEVVVFNREGVVRRIEIPLGKEIDLTHHRIFRHDDQLLCLALENSRFELSKWNEDHFALLPRDECEKFIRQHVIDRRALPKHMDELERLTEKSGWKQLVMTWLVFKDEFEWAGHSFELTTVPIDNCRRKQIHLQCKGPDHPWRAVLLECNRVERRTTWAQYNRICDGGE